MADSPCRLPLLSAAKNGLGYLFGGDWVTCIPQATVSASRRHPIPSDCAIAQLLSFFGAFTRRTLIKFDSFYFLSWAQFAYNPS